MASSFLFADTREVRDAIPVAAFFGIGLRTPRRRRIGVAVENFDAVTSSTNSELQRATESHCVLILLKSRNSFDVFILLKISLPLEMRRH